MRCIPWARTCFPWLYPVPRETSMEWRPDKPAAKSKRQKEQRERTVFPGASQASRKTNKNIRQPVIEGGGRPQHWRPSTAAIFAPPPETTPPTAATRREDPPEERDRQQAKQPGRTQPPLVSA